MKSTERDNFPTWVKRALADRAGHRCSVCGKPTVGPAKESAGRISDAWAAHITAASRNGARFDPSLPPAERSGFDNGIHACTKHGREIDTDASAYPVEVLRGLKRAREEAAYAELEGLPAHSSTKLLDVPYARTTYELFDAISQEEYTFTTMWSMRGLIHASDEPNTLHRLGAELVMEVRNSHPKVAGLCATLLSNGNELWNPTASNLDALEEICAVPLSHDDWTRVDVLEPLTFALAGKGRPKTYEIRLLRQLDDRHWRRADADRAARYYGGTSTYAASIVRHWHDPYRTGLLRANDTPRVIELLVNDVDLTHRSRQGVVDLALDHAAILQQWGLREPAKKVSEFAQATAVQGRGRS